MHANHFRRLALAQGLLPSQRASAPEQDDVPGAAAAADADRRAATLVEPETSH